MTNSVWLVAYRRVFSATNVAVRAQRIDTTGALVGSYLGLATSGKVCANPKVANLNLRDVFVVVWQEATSLFGDFDIVCRTVAAASGAMSAQVDVAASTSDETDPDIAGDNSLTGDAALVVYRQGDVTPIVLRRMTVAAGGAAPVLASTTTLGAINATARYPVISKSNPGDGVYFVCYAEDGSSTSFIETCAVDRSGTRLAGPVALMSGSLATGGVDRCDVDGDGTHFVVAYEKFEAAGTALRDVWCRSFDWNGTAITATTYAAALADTAGTDQRQPAVTCCGAKFAVLYTNQPYASSNNNDILVRELSPTCINCGPTSLLSGLTPTSLRQVEHSAAAASALSGGGVSDDTALIVFTESDDQPPFTSSLIAQRFEAMVGQAAVNRGGGCGYAGSIATSGGPFSPGNLSFRINLSAVPSGALPILMFAVPNNTGTCGVCTYVNGFANLYVHPVLGRCTYNWALPCGYSFAANASIEVQWVIVGSGTTPCTLFPDVALSDRLLLTLAW